MQYIGKTQTTNASSLSYKYLAKLLVLLTKQIEMLGNQTGQAFSFQQVFELWTSLSLS